MKFSITTRTLINSALVLVLFSLASFAMAAERTLLIWISGDRDYTGVEKVGEEFTRKTGVNVVVEHPDDAELKFRQAASAGKGPDIWIWSHEGLGEWVVGGLLQAVTPRKAVREAVESYAWNAFTVGGKIYGYPISLEAVSLIYNKDLVATPPKNFDDVLALHPQLKATGKQTILWDYTNIYFTWPLLAAGGGYTFARKLDGTIELTKTGVNHVGSVAGVNTLMKLISSGTMAKGYGYAGMEKAFASGQVAMIIDGPWAWASAKKAGINFGVAPIPNVNGKPASPFVGVLGAMVTRASRNQTLATEFLEEHMLTVEGLRTINAAVPLGVPANRALFNELRADPLIQAGMVSTKSGVLMLSNLEMAHFWSSMRTALENITEGRQSTQEALDAAAKRILTGTK